MGDVQIDSVSKRFGSRGEVVALDHVSLSIKSGDFLVLLGPSGCGKTTLLRSIAGLELPDSGEISVGGRCVFSGSNGTVVPAHRRGIGMMFQNYALWPHMTVARNIGYPLKVRRVDRRERERAIADMLKLIQCEGLAQRLPSQLSGGQQQRVALARSLMGDPSVVLFDEPLSNMDAQLRRDLRAELRNYQARLGFTGIYVTHDQIEALELGTQVAVLGSGVVKQIGTPEEVHDTPASPYVAEFLGIENLFSLASVDGRWRIRNDDDGVRSDSTNPQTKHVMYVRAAAIRISGSDFEPALSEDPAIVLGSGTVTDVLYGGVRSAVLLDLNGKKVRAETNDSRVRVGDRVVCWCPSSLALVYENECLLPAESVRARLWSLWADDGRTPHLVRKTRI